MNLKQKMKNFFTLTRKANGGFTLVELIVVIAILAILGGVAVPAYSGYVKKANMQADMTLVSDVAHALQLAYYGDINSAASDYVILKTTGASAEEDGFADAAMTAAFGEGWADSLSLAYDGWTDDGMLDFAAGYTEDELQLIAGSSFLTNSTSEGLMNAVTGLTGLVGDVIREKSADPVKARNNLTKIFGEDSDILDKLDALEEDGLKDGDYPTAISNLLVNTMATTIETEPCLQAMINLYATAFAYAEKTGDTAALEQMDKNLENVSMSILSYEGTAKEAYGVGYRTMLEGMTETTEAGDIPAEEFADFLAYLDSSADQITSDNEALSTMMGAVKKISDNFVDVKSVTNPELYATGEVAEQVNNYMNAVKALADMDTASRAALKGLDAGTVVVLIAGNGVVSVVPSAAFAQD